MSQTVENLCAEPRGVAASALGQYKQALAKFPTGVAVVTARASTGKPIGLTVNSFVSISLEPAVVSWSLRLTSSLFDHFSEAGSFVVNVLATDQAGIADQFAARVSDRFEGIRWHAGVCGDPVLAGAAAVFECEEVSSLVVGDHLVFFGGIVGFSGSDREPLIMLSGKVVNGNGIRKPEREVKSKQVEILEIPPVLLVGSGVGSNLIF